MAFFQPHLETAECEKQKDRTTFGGYVVFCEGSARLRKIKIAEMQPAILMDLAISLGNRAYVDETDVHYTTIMKERSIQFFPNSYDFVLQTGQDYVVKTDWGQDPTFIHLWPGNHRESDDAPTTLLFNYNHFIETFDVKNYVHHSSVERGVLENYQDLDDLENFYEFTKREPGL